MQNELIKAPARIIEIFEDESTISQFEAILHSGANSFIKSALLVIAASPDLMNCSPQSLANGALRSATLGLSLDPALRQAYLVPRPLKGTMVACFQPHYSGLYDLAVRTNLYRYISVMPIHKGERVMQDPQTGIHYYMIEGGSTIFSPVLGEGGLKAENMRDVTEGKPSTPVIGYLGYFRTIKGFEKTVWMTLGEIQAHALLWSPGSYNSERGAWQDFKKRPIMEMKTVFIALSKFMDLSGSASKNLKAAIDDETLPEDELPIDATEPRYEDLPETISQDEEPAAELIIESKVPAARPAAILKANEIIADSDWANFIRLVDKGTAAGIQMPVYIREDMTATRVNYAGKYIQQQLNKAGAA